MLKKRKIIHRAVSILLASFIGIGSCISGYVNVRAESIALSGSFAFIETLLMSMGYTCGLSDLATKPDSEIKDLEDKLNEWMKSDYDRIVEKYVASYPDLPPWGSPTPAPTSSPPATIAPGEPVSQPMTWEEIQSQALKEKNLDLLKMGAATFWCLKQAVTDLWNNFVSDESTNNSFSSTDFGNEEYFPELSFNGYSKVGSISFDTDKGLYVYYQQYYTALPLAGIIFVSDSYGVRTGRFFDSDFIIRGCNNTQIYFRDGVRNERNTFSGGNPEEPSPSYNSTFFNYSFSLPIYTRSDLTYSDIDTPDELRAVIEGSSAEPRKKDDIWVVPTLKDAYDSNQSPSLPDTYPPAITLPTLQELKDLAQQGDDDEENRPVILNEFITNHYTKTDADPDPEPTPDPGGSGEEGGDTGGDTGGDSGDLDPAPSPTPTPDEENGQYKSPGLRNFFPFCIPFDLYDLFVNFTANRKAPRFEFPLKSERFGIDEVVVIDLAVFDDVAAVLRLLELILFVVLLAVASRKLIGAL